MKNNINELLKVCSQVRRDILRMVYFASSGHPGGSLGCVEFFVAIYWEIMCYKNTFHIDGEDEDILFVSNGHISPVWYSCLARKGFFEVKELHTFRKINSRLQGHPATKEKLPGIRIASGSLGQGLSVAIGAALSKKLNKDKKNVFILMGDGEQQEGQIWEAAMFAAHHKVNNLIAFVDCNGQQIDGKVKEVMDIKNLEQKWKAFGWEVLSCNGNDIEKMIHTIQKVKNDTKKEKPTVILLDTVMGKGVDFMENKHQWHGVAPNKEQLEKALEQLEETLGDF